MYNYTYSLMRWSGFLNRHTSEVSPAGSYAHPSAEKPTERARAPSVVSEPPKVYLFEALLPLLESYRVELRLGYDESPQPFPREDVHVLHRLLDCLMAPRWGVVFVGFGHVSRRIMRGRTCSPLPIAVSEILAHFPRFGTKHRCCFRCCCRRCDKSAKLLWMDGISWRTSQGHADPCGDATNSAPPPRRQREQPYLFLLGIVAPKPGQHRRVGSLADDLDGAVFGPDDHAHALAVAGEAQHVENLQRRTRMYVRKGRVVAV